MKNHLLLLCLCSLSLGTIAQETIYDFDFDSSNLPPSVLTQSNDLLFMRAYDTTDLRSNALWVSDGTTGGTRKLGIDSIKVDLVRSMTDFNNQLFFYGRSIEHGLELWKSDGTVAGTKIVKDIDPGPSGSWWLTQGGHEMAAAADAVVFTVRFDTTEIWRSDGTEAGTYKIAGALGASGMTSYKGEVYFYGGEYAGNQFGLYKTDGTAQGTVFLQQGIFPLVHNGFLERPAATRDYLFFLSQNISTLDAELWRTDGTPAGTVKVIDLLDEPYRTRFRQLFGVDTLAYFVGYDVINGYEPWLSDGTPAGTRIIKNISPDDLPSYPLHFLKLGDYIYFEAAGRLYRTDGTDSNTVVQNTPSGFSRVNHNDRFIHFQDDNKIWQFDPEKNETVQISDWPDWLVFENVQYYKDDLYFLSDERLLKIDLGDLTSIDEKEPAKHSVSLFPNPTGDRFYLQGIPPGSRPLLSIFDSTGRLINHLPYSISGIDSSEIPVGLYFVRISVGEEVFTAKLIKQ